MSAIWPSPATGSGHETRSLSPVECRDRLQRRHEGRLSCLTGRGPRAVVIDYAVDGNDIVLRIPEYNDLAPYATSSEITLLVDVPGPPGSGPALVTVTGRAEVVEHGEHIAPGPKELAEVWPSGLQTWTLRLSLEHLEGYEDLG